MEVIERVTNCKINKPKHQTLALSETLLEGLEVWLLLELDTVVAFGPKTEDDDGDGVGDNDRDGKTDPGDDGDAMGDVSP